MKLFFWHYGNSGEDFFHLKKGLHFRMAGLIPLSMIVLLILSGGISISFQSNVFAQNQSSSSTNKNIAQNNNATSRHQIILKPGTNNQTQQPSTLTNISNRGIYKVRLGLNSPLTMQSPSLPKSAFDMVVLFMNASTSPGPLESNFLTPTSRQGDTRYSVPGNSEHLLPVDRFDMIIYGSHGKTLWNAVNQPVTGGRGFELIELPNGYAGDITILIHNIKSSNSMTGNNNSGLTTPLLKGTTDSVEFTAKVG
ncbi:MAG: hypothetical protein DLM72_08860 [Candidatus Nitrosopolaris wilkensis]|nr:MAG: hypothetical protein DLM72_08860 [Candidatus Nitrosopolaris wilkensis]